jgi:hypothetical protein
MNKELNEVPVAEQLEEIEQVDEAIETEYSLNPDGSVEKLEGEMEKPKTA